MMYYSHLTGSSYNWTSTRSMIPYIFKIQQADAEARPPIMIHDCQLLSRVQINMSCDKLCTRQTLGPMLQPYISPSQLGYYMISIEPPLSCKSSKLKLKQGMHDSLTSARYVKIGTVGFLWKQ